MRIMVANNTHGLVHFWAGKYGGLGHLYSPARIEKPVPWLPYALDNGAFSAFTSGNPWNEALWIKHVERYAFNALRPQWAIVPDVVANRDATLANWVRYAPVMVKDYHLDLAIAVQDGMSFDDVEQLDPKPSIVFVGGSTEWKWETIGDWARAFPRVHVGRVNSAKCLNICASLGIESCDGTGWFRGKAAQIMELGVFLAAQAGQSIIEVEWVVGHTRRKTMDQGVIPLPEVAG